VTVTLQDQPGGTERASKPFTNGISKLRSELPQRMPPHAFHLAASWTAAARSLTADRYGYLFSRGDDAAELAAAEKAFLTA
jgi:hypothetical protein